MTSPATRHALRRAMLAGLADGRPHTTGELVRACHVGRRRFAAQRRELVNLGCWLTSTSRSS